MDLKAKKKQRTLAQKPPASPAFQSVSPSPNNTYTHSLTIQCNALLYTTMQNMVKAAHTANDFTYTSVTDVLRSALQAYQSGMELTELEEPGQKKQTSIRVSNSLYNFYKSLPNQMRTKLIERAIRTFLKNQFK